MFDHIVVRGAREHNLRDVDIRIPREKLTVITGVSGSGKSSLAFDTLYAEGQRRYIESLSTYARQFLERIKKPDVDEVLGISPSIAIQQKNTTRSSRSTVGTATEIYDYLRLLFARAGQIHCPECDTEVVRHTPDDVIDHLLESHAGDTILLIASKTVGKGKAPDLVAELIREGFTRILLRDEVVKLETKPRGLGRLRALDVVLDRVVVKSSRRARLLDAIEAAYALSQGFVRVRGVDVDMDQVFTREPVCVTCGRRFEEPRPILFSFNTPYGACPHCRGFGNRMEFDESLIVPDPDKSLADYAVEPWSSPRFEYFQDRLVQFARRRRIPLARPWRTLPERSRRLVLDGDKSSDYVGVLPFLERMREKSYKKYARFFTRRFLTYRECRHCHGGRLREDAYTVRLGGKTIRDVAAMVPGSALEWVDDLHLCARDRAVVTDVLTELCARLRFLLDVGLYYITLDRLTRTLSGGESQRITLANSLGARLLDVLYVLDEPSIGLHPRDTDQLVRVLEELRDRGNTVVVVEHDPDIIRRADYVIDLGPGAGENGGTVVYEGPVNGTGASARASRTLRYIRDGVPITRPPRRRRRHANEIVLERAYEHNLHDITVAFPIGAFTCVTGVSGSGKSTLVCDVLYNALRMNGESSPVGCHALRGAQSVSSVLLVDQAPIGRTPRSNPVTYIKAFAAIRDLFAATPMAKSRGYASGRFSFNVAGGRCTTCQGMGYERVEMHFMADLFVQCSECGGARFNRDTLEVRWNGLSLADVLELTVDQAVVRFAGHAALVRRLDVLRSVGLGYLRLGQPSTTLSGGESQRIKLARELAESTAGGSVYLLDEPTTGLHVDDVQTLIGVLRKLQDAGNTIIVVEHNPQVVVQADHVVDLGPGGGDEGGKVVVAGTPAQVARARGSYTGAYLRRLTRTSRKVHS